MSVSTCPDSREFALAAAAPTMPGWAAGGPAATQFSGSPDAPGHAVSAQVANRQVQIRSEDGTVAVDWPLNAVRAVAAPSGAVRFRFGADPGRLVVGDAYMLEVLRHHVRRWPGQRRQRLAMAAAALALGAGLLAPSAWPALLASLVPAWPVAAVAASMPAEALPGGRCAVDAEGQRAMDALVTRIATAPSLVAVMDDAALNAAGAPHRFAVTRGLIAAAADGDELAGLLAWRLGGGGQPQPASASMLPVSATTGRAITARVAPYKAASDEPAAALLRAAGLRTDGLARFVERTRAKGSLPEYLSGYPAQAGARAQAGTGGRGAPAVTPAKWKALRGLCGAG